MIRGLLWSLAERCRIFYKRNYIKTKKDNSEIIVGLQKDIDDLKIKARKDTADWTFLQLEPEEFEIGSESFQNLKITLRQEKEHTKALTNYTVNLEEKEFLVPLLRTNNGIDMNSVWAFVPVTATLVLKRNAGNAHRLFSIPWQDSWISKAEVCHFQHTLI